MDYCDHGYGRPSWLPRVSPPATYCSSAPRVRVPAVVRLHAHLHGLVTAIHEMSGLVEHLGVRAIVGPIDPHIRKVKPAVLKDKSKPFAKEIARTPLNCLMIRDFFKMGRIMTSLLDSSRKSLSVGFTLVRGDCVIIGHPGQDPRSGARTGI